MYGLGLLVCSSHSRHLAGSILFRGVAGRSIGLLRRDLLLQIDPSASGARACYILRPGPLITSFLTARPRRRALAAAIPSSPFPEAPCYRATTPPRRRPPASASALTPRATATTPPSSARTCNRPPPSWPSPSPPTATPNSGSDWNSSPA